MHVVDKMLRLPKGRARTQAEKEADSAAWKAGSATCADDIFTLRSIPDLESEMFHYMAFWPGPHIAVPGLTPEDEEYPIIILRGELVRTVRQSLDIVVARTEDTPFEKIGHIALREMELYPDYEDLRQFMACAILDSLGFQIPEECSRKEPPELVVNGCNSGFTPEGWRRLYKRLGNA